MKSVEGIAAASSGDWNKPTAQLEPRLARQWLQQKSEEATLQKMAHKQLQEGAGFDWQGPSTG